MLGFASLNACGHWTGQTSLTQGRRPQATEPVVGGVETPAKVCGLGIFFLPHEWLVDSWSYTAHWDWVLIWAGEETNPNFCLDQLVRRLPGGSETPAVP